MGPPFPTDYLPADPPTNHQWTTYVEKHTYIHTLTHAHIGAFMVYMLRASCEIGSLYNIICEKLYFTWSLHFFSYPIEGAA